MAVVCSLVDILIKQFAKWILHLPKYHAEFCDVFICDTRCGEEKHFNSKDMATQRGRFLFSKVNFVDSTPYILHLELNLYCYCVTVSLWYFYFVPISSILVGLLYSRPLLHQRVPREISKERRKVERRWWGDEEVDEEGVGRNFNLFFANLCCCAKTF